jgi:hypothetical protein
MFHRTFIGLIVIVVASSLAPFQPTAAQPVPGNYVISFLSNGAPISSTLPVGEELVLKAHVTDSSNVDAQLGAVAFQVCSRKGGRSLIKLDPGPSSDCDVDGTGTWVHLYTAKVNAGLCPEEEGPGFVCVNWGFISSPRTIGFRFRYTGQGSGIANGISQPKDASWVIIP